MYICQPRSFVGRTLSGIRCSTTAGGQRRLRLLHQSDGTANVKPKPLETYVHNMTTILNDTSSDFTAGTVNCSVANEPCTVHDLLMEKSNGTYELIVWGAQVAPKSANVIVNLGSSHPTVKVYDITSGTTPVQRLSNACSVPLTPLETMG
jgi:hypothetical protein